MSVKLLYSSEKTNSFRPVPWHWSLDPFPAFRGAGARYRAFQPAGKGYEPSFVDGIPGSNGYDAPRDSFDPTATRIVKTAEKGTLLLVPCSDAQDEPIMLLTLRGGFRGHYSRIEVVGADVLFHRNGNMHCCPTGHMVVRLTHPNGYVFAETGRRCGTGEIEIFSWAGYQTMPTEDFEVWRVSHGPDLTDASRAAATAKAEADRVAAVVRAKEQQQERTAKARVEAETEAARKAYDLRMRPELLRRLDATNGRVTALGGSHPASIAKPTDDGASFLWYVQRLDTTEENVARVERHVEQVERDVAEKERKRLVRETFQPRFEAFTARAEALGLTVEFTDDRVRLTGDYYGQPYSDEGLTQFVADLDRRERQAAETRTKADAEATYQHRKTEATALGLPTDVRIWCRRGGRTNAGDGWVISPNGQDRDDTAWYNPRPHHSSEGDKIWEQILKGEVVLKWSKSNSAAPHEFEVVYLPTEGLTEAQLERIQEIQDELEREWAGARGLASGIPSPSVGSGWGLHTASAPHPTEMPPFATSADLRGMCTTQTPTGAPVDLSKVDLTKLFGGAKKR